MPHGILLSGREGGSVLMEAYYTVLCLMCQQFSATSGPCLRCNNCQRVSKWVHPDVHFVPPSFDAAHESKDLLPPWREFASENDFVTVAQWAEKMDSTRHPNINRRQTRELIHHYHFKAFEGGKKVFFIWGAEYLDKESNRMLKILEEPTDNTYFVLVSYDKNQLLPTILSRMQQFDIPRVSGEQMVQYAKEQGQKDEDRIWEVVHLTDGNVVEMMQILEQDKQVFSEILLEVLRSAYSRNGVRMADWAEKAAKMSHREYFYFIRYQLHFLREALAGFAQEGYEKKLLPNERKAAEWLLGQIKFADLFQLVSEMDQYSRALRQHGNLKILSMKMALEYKRLFHNN